MFAVAVLLFYSVDGLSGKEIEESAIAYGKVVGSVQITDILIPLNKIAFHVMVLALRRDLT